MNAGAVTLQGHLCCGLGEGAGFTALDWVEHQFHDKLGFWPHPGILNLNLAGDDWNTKALKAMLDATPPGALMMEPVSKKINSVKNDTAEALFETQGSLL